MFINLSRTQTLHHNSTGVSKLDLYTFLKAYAPYMVVQGACRMGGRQRGFSWVIEFLLESGWWGRAAISTTYPSVQRFCVWKHMTFPYKNRGDPPFSLSGRAAHLWRTSQPAQSDLKHGEISSLHFSPARYFSINQVRSVFCIKWRVSLI